MKSKTITPCVKATPLHKGLIAWALSLVVALLSNICPQSARAEVQFIEEPASCADLYTPVYQWRDSAVEPRAVVLCIHGFASHGTAYRSLARALAANGMLVYALDIRGFGKTYFNGRDRRVSYDTFADHDVSALAHALRSAHPGLKLYVCGESMGASLALRLAAAEPHLVDGLILSAPSVKLKKHLRFVVRCFVGMIFHHGLINVSWQILHFGAADPAVGRQILQDPLTRTRFRASELIEVLRITRQTRELVGTIPARVPILLLQASDDRTVSPRVVKILRQDLRTTDLTVVVSDHRGHVQLEVNRPQADIVRVVSAWLDAHVVGSSEED